MLYGVQDEAQSCTSWELYEVMYNNIGYRGKETEVTWRGSYASIGYKGMPPGTALFKDTEDTPNPSIVKLCLQNC